MKRYAKISPSLRSRCDERVELFETEPNHPLLHNHALQGDRRGQWSINITGDWRAIYEFQDENTVIFIDIDTHSNLYN
ncbi:MAG: type II toxin-antitoxin system mRNA interferase toxin, RelE/StbE family [bacterium]|nr:type II toxin-antitoxin system mRNA interferase toxin, RelE/StbE family [bacterium]